jgi:putative lipoic acid-binding regulatory protein
MITNFGVFKRFMWLRIQKNSQSKASARIFIQNFNTLRAFQTKAFIIPFIFKKFQVQFAFISFGISKHESLRSYSSTADGVIASEQRSGSALENLKYPTKFPIKVIAVDSSQLIQDIINRISAKLKVYDEEFDRSQANTSAVGHDVYSGSFTNMSHSVRIQGKYISLTITASYQNAQQIYDIYKILHSIQSDDEHRRIKYVF